MKRFLSVICGLLMGVSMYAHESLAFLGISFQKPFNEFMTELMAQGYKEIADPSEGMYFLSGKFDDRTCTSIVEAEGEKVGKVTLRFPAVVCWKSVHYEYVHYQRYFNKKYGNPVKTRNNVEKDFRFGMEFWAFDFDAIGYNSVYQTAEGTVKLYITSDNAYDGYVVIEFLPNK